MDKWELFNPLYFFWLVMTYETPISSSFPLPLDDISVAILAYAFPIYKDIHMVIGDSSQGKRLICYSMATETTANRFSSLWAYLSSEMT
jgi:hypothetical protein